MGKTRRHCLTPISRARLVLKGEPAYLPAELEQPHATNVDGLIADWWQQRAEATVGQLPPRSALVKRLHERMAQRGNR